jgi:hypothetical protein
MTITLQSLIASYNAIRDDYRANPESKNDEDGAVWIDAYYAVINHAIASPTDAIAKCRFVADAIDGKDMGWFEEERVIRQIAALADLPHPDAKLIELGKQFESAKVATLPLDRARKASFAASEEAIADAGIPDCFSDRTPEQDKIVRKISRDVGYEANYAAFTKAHGECIRLMKAIHRTKATTLEGFAVKVAAIAFDQSDFDLGAPEPEDVAERMLYRVARDMAKVVKAGGRANG